MPESYVLCLPVKTFANSDMKTKVVTLSSTILLLLAGQTSAQQTVLDTLRFTFTQDTIRLNLISDADRLSSINDSIDLGEVVVKGSRKPKTNSRWNDMHPVELATAGGTNGNLYQALQTLPGTQMQGESGRLLVRGGSSHETQTYIDGMHVLKPYTTTDAETPARGRYSPFMFSGINLSTGGQPQEYGEALSAVLPLETKDHSRINKLGINLSTVGVGGGGTRAFDKGSASLNLDYQNLGPYYGVYPSRVDFEHPYRNFSGGTQLRYTPDEATVLKLYAGYDRTDFSSYTGADRRIFGLGEDNVYLNTTFRRRTGKDWNWFAGAAWSFYRQQVDAAMTSGDHWMEQQQELHLKVKFFKRLLPFWRMDAGAESLIRQYKDHYAYEAVDAHNRMNPSVTAGFLSSTFYLLENLKTELSVRGEYTEPNGKINLSPRLAVDYTWGDLSLSGTAGRYTQLPDNKYLLQQRDLLSETCVQYNFGLRYEQTGRYYKAELYYKKYDRLALATPTGGVTDTPIANITSDGYGTAKGIDLFFNDRVLIPRLEYQLSYSYNLSRRKFQEYTELTTPQYSTRHNAVLVLKYTIPAINTILGLTEHFASGRPYHNPARPGLMNDEVKPYNSLDLALTFLVSRKVIIHASATNILGRKNEFGRVDGRALRPSSDHFFYLGVYITLGKKAAYDVSNF